MTPLARPTHSSTNSEHNTGPPTSLTIIQAGHSYHSNFGYMVTYLQGYKVICNAMVVKWEQKSEN